jgi:hypothetical protein
MATITRAAKLILASTLAIPLAVVSGAQALSSASLRNAPELAASAFPYNGLALEKLAHRAFIADVQRSLVPEQRQGSDASDDAGLQGQLQVDVSELQSFARGAADAARTAFRMEPLATRAHVVLAIAEDDPARKRALVALASDLNRRDMALQALVLQQRIDDRDYKGTIATLDQILRVNPEQESRFFPLLVEAMANEKTTPAFERILSQPLPWREPFLRFAVGNRKVLDRLAAIRERVPLDNPEFDKRLIAGLAQEGRLDIAERAYQTIARPSGGGKSSTAWVSDYPPFDWKLADEAGLRAQVSRNGERLEVLVDPGNGGVLASRLIQNPKGPLAFSFTHDIAPEEQLKDVQVVVGCRGTPQPILEQALTPGKNSVSITSVPDCAFLELAIRARAWTGGRALSGSIGPIAWRTN